jgi:alpha-tubulin suppressor-like RCC1 family protein
MVGVVITTDSWGINYDHYISKPQLILLPEKIIQVSAGMHYSLGLAASGRVYAWGWNGFGQLGLGDLQARPHPTLIPNLFGVRSIAAGEMHSVAVGREKFCLDGEVMFRIKSGNPL